MEEWRLVDAQRVEQLVSWPACGNLSKIQGFLWVAADYTICVNVFYVVAAPGFDLQHKTMEFVLEPEQEQAMGTVKQALTTAPTQTTPQVGSENGALRLILDK